MNALLEGAAGRPDPIRRRLLQGVAFGMVAPALPAAAQAPSVRKAAATPWRWVINEAVTGETNFFLLTSRYRPWADFMTGHLKGRPIGIEPVVDIKRFMVVAQGQPKPELVFGKSVNQLAKLVRDNGYQPVVRRADPYKAAFIVAKNSPIKTLADAARARIVMPDEYAATTAVARAELRRQNITSAEIVHVRFQEAVAQQVKSGAGQVGVVNPTTARKWAEEGGRVIAETQPVVNWSVLTSPHVAADTVAQLQEALLGMNTRETAILGALGIKEWAKAERKDFLALLDYTKE
jgi:ABC-type phosphate/phosphonate transport system substrate-binding protein